MIYNIPINLNDENNKPISVFKHVYNRNPKKVAFMSERNPSYTCSRLALEVDTQNTPDFIKKNFSEIFKIALPDFKDVSPSCEFKGLYVTKKNLNLDILCFPEKLKIPNTYLYENNLIIPITVNLIFKPNAKEEALQKQYTFKLSILREKARVDVTIVKNDRFKENVIYERKKLDFGTIFIKNVAKQSFSYPLNLKNLKFTITDNKGGKYDDAIFIETSPPEAHGNNTKKGGVPYGDSEPLNLKINLKKLHHPEFLSTYKITFFYGESMTDNLNWDDRFKVEINDISFVLNKNEQTTELFVKYQDGNGSDKKEISDLRDHIAPIQLADKVYVLSSKKNYPILSGTIGNRATIDEKTPKSLVIKNIEINPGLEKKSQIKQKEGTAFDIKNHIQFSIKKPNEPDWIPFINIPNEPINLPNANDSYISFRVELDNSSFKCLPNEENKMSVLLPISYSYAIQIKNNEPDKADFKKCTHRYRFDLKQNEGGNWLSIDFGTSAIVAEYGDGDSDNNSNLSLNLQEKHKANLESTKKDFTYDEHNIEEYNTPFLSSTVLFNHTNIEALTEAYSSNGDLKDSITLSPTKYQVKNSQAYLSPYIKSLIGYNELPYKFQKRIDEENPPSILVNRIIEAAYSELLLKYIKPIIDEKREHFESNKIILSVPNTFTSRHKNILQKLLKKVLPELWENYIRFASESDVVACFYALNYTDLIQNYCVPKNEGNLEHYKENRQVEGDTVLIYDMGAGTLDLTLFRKNHIEDGRFKIEILGKTGFTTAGNYLDTILAEIAYEQVKNKNQNFHPIENFENSWDVALPYKLFIRNKLKPNLTNHNIDNLEDDEKSIQLPDPDSTLETEHIEFDRIKDSGLFKDYLEKITTQAISFLYHNLRTDPDKIKIKTLMITGRGSQLHGLKDKLEEAIKNSFGGIDDDQFLTILPESKEMKSVVAKGAINYVCSILNSKNEYKALHIHARIGYLVFRDTGISYEELISPKHNRKLTSDSTFSEAEKEGYVFIKELNLYNVKKILIVQTYYYDKKKIKEEYSKKKHGDFFDTSTSLFQFKPGRGENEFEPCKLGELRVLICEDGEVFARIITPNNAGILPDPRNTSTIDIENSKSFEKSMWPILQPNNT